MNGHLIRLTGPYARTQAKRLIDAAPLGALVQVRPETRTNDQNAKMWALLSDVSRSKPQGRMHTPDIWKSLFMAACGHAVQFENGLDGAPFPIGFRSSKLTKEQMGELIDFIEAWGTQHGVVWTDQSQEAA